MHKVRNMKKINVAIILYVISVSLLITSTQSIEVEPDDIDDDVTLEDLKNLGADCELDNCLNATYELDGLIDEGFYNLSVRKCDCGALCIDYDTCCVDSPYRKDKTIFNRTRNSQVWCVDVHSQPDPYFMVDECSSSWNSSSLIENKCYAKDLSDPYTLIPAFDHENNVTYKNFFCGICNGIKPESLTMWNVIINPLSYRNHSYEELVGNMTFDEKYKHWGYWVDAGYGPFFHSLEIIIDIPKQSNLKPCLSYIVEDCDPEWSDRTVSEKCLSYLAPIYAFKKDGSYEFYRNIHCAICNYAALDPENVCTVAQFGGGGGSPTISFTLLLDVNAKDGAQVGKIDKCKADESYDPFFKKCRSLTCGLPGYVLKGNKCSRS